MNKMKAEQLVCSLENATKLQELGVRVPSYFEYKVCVPEDAPLRLPDDVVPCNRRGVPPKYYFQYRFTQAYTVGELGEMLPLESNSERCIGCYEVKTKEAGDNFFSVEDTEADARALMLIWLIENRHLTLEEINQ